MSLPTPREADLVALRDGTGQGPGANRRVPEGLPVRQSYARERLEVLRGSEPSRGCGEPLGPMEMFPGGEG